MSAQPNEVSPSEVLRQVALAIPEPVRRHIIVIGSLAAAHWFGGDDPTFSVRTKDVDGVLTPHSLASMNAKVLAEALRGSGWHPKKEGKFGAPGTSATPDDQLPALRWYPPLSADWFIELLTEPESEAQTGRTFTRFALDSGENYGLPSFRFTSIATFDAAPTALGLRVARAEMMALANLLEHPEVRPDVVADTSDKRSNKDLGRVLAIARLSKEADVEQWPDAWLRALQDRFPGSWRALAGRAGDGIRALVASPADLQQASEIANNGLLARSPLSAEQMRVTAERLLLELAQLERLAR